MIDVLLSGLGGNMMGGTPRQHTGGDGMANFAALLGFASQDPGAETQARLSGPMATLSYGVTDDAVPSATAPGARALPLTHLMQTALAEDTKAGQGSVTTDAPVPAVNTAPPQQLASAQPVVAREGNLAIAVEQADQGAADAWDAPDSINPVSGHGMTPTQGIAGADTGKGLAADVAVAPGGTGTSPILHRSTEAAAPTGPIPVSTNQQAPVALPAANSVPRIAADRAGVAEPVDGPIGVAPKTAGQDNVPPAARPMAAVPPIQLRAVATPAPLPAAAPTEPAVADPQVANTGSNPARGGSAPQVNGPAVTAQMAVPGTATATLPAGATHSAAAEQGAIEMSLSKVINQVAVPQPIPVDHSTRSLPPRPGKAQAAPAATMVGAPVATPATPPHASAEPAAGLLPADQIPVDEVIKRPMAGAEAVIGHGQGAKPATANGGAASPANPVAAMQPQPFFDSELPGSPAPLTAATATGELPTAAQAPLTEALGSKAAPKPLAGSLLSQVRAVSVEEGRTTIQLHPRGLGTIEIEMRIESDVASKVVVRVENPVVLNNLRDERQMLAQTIGIADSSVIAFEDRPAGDMPAGDEPHEESSSSTAPHSETDDTPAQAHQNVLAGGALDVLT